MSNNSDYDRDDRRPRRVRYRDNGYERPVSREVSVLGVIALVLGVLSLVGSLVPCLGIVAVFPAVLSLVLSLAAVLIARSSRQSMGFPVAATVVSGSAVAMALVWAALFGALMRGEERASVRHAPQPQLAPPMELPPRQVPPGPNPGPMKKAEPKQTDEEFQKQLLEDIRKDRIKEAIRNGPGLAVTAEKLETDHLANVVAAEAKYKDQVLEVTGAVVRVTREPKQTTYLLELNTGEPTKTVNCTFTEQKKHPLASVERGQQITVRGLCTGRANEFVQLKDCVLVK